MSDYDLHTSFPFVFHKDLGEVVGRQFGSGLYPCLKIVAIPKYRSLITLQIKVRFLLDGDEFNQPNESNEVHEFTTALHLTSAHVSSILVEERNEEYRKVTINLNKTQLHATGLFGNRDFGNQTPDVTSLFVGNQGNLSTSEDDVAGYDSYVAKTMLSTTLQKLRVRVTSTIDRRKKSRSH